MNNIHVEIGEHSFVVSANKVDIQFNTVFTFEQWQEIVPAIDDAVEFFKNHLGKAVKE